MKTHLLPSPPSPFKGGPEKQVLMLKVDSGLLLGEPERAPVYCMYISYITPCMSH